MNKYIEQNKAIEEAERQLNNAVSNVANAANNARDELESIVREHPNTDKYDGIKDILSALAMWGAATNAYGDAITGR